MVNFIWENIFRRAEKGQDIDRAIADNYLFKGLNKSERAFVRTLLHERQYRAGEAVFRQGELGIGMYMIVHGSINITVEDASAVDEASKATFITRLSDGDFFGEIALVEQAGRRTATATAASESALLGFFKPDLAEVVERNPRLAVKILTHLAEVLGRRLKETTDRFTEVKRNLRELSKSEKNGKS